MSSAFAELGALAPIILGRQQAGTLNAAFIEGEAQRAARVTLGDYTATITRAGTAPGQPSRIGVMFLPTGPDEFLILGSGDAQVTFSTDRQGLCVVGIESIDEQIFRAGKWISGRRLNGDESSQGQALKISSTDLAQGKLYKIRLHRYR